MTKHRNDTKGKLYHLAAHVPEDVYLKVKSIADEEDRSLSYIAQRLLLKGFAVESLEERNSRERLCEAISNVNVLKQIDRVGFSIPAEGEQK